MNDKTNKPPPQRSIFGILIAVLLGGGLAMAGSQASVIWNSYPAFAIAAVLAYGIQWLAFIPAYLSQSERYYDLIGSLTYLSVTWFAFSVSRDAYSMLLTVLISLWAVRLGSFLFLRIRDAGSDRRFDRIKPFFFRFLMTWTLQGLWVLLTAGAALAAMTSAGDREFNLFTFAGAVIWLGGFAIEVTADRQKREFRKDPANSGAFIRGGLWSWSRHPNYFGEIVLWSGIAIIAFPALQGWQTLTLVSPLFVFLLLTRVSGIPMLEAHAKKRWGEDPEYQQYRAQTSRLLLRPPNVR
ncbi:MAG: DUF1295 domain-containing protein [Pseudomonadota bacterium]